MKNNFVLVTGGMGFIGSEVVQKLLDNNYFVINVDKLTYASNKSREKVFKKYKNYRFYKYDIVNKNQISYLFKKYKPVYVLNIAAESHVDNSINEPKNFIDTNIIGTYNLLTNTNLLYKKKIKTKFIQISTDEVYGDIINKKSISREGDPYIPSSPYSASKASADHLVRSWSRTYGINYNITCSANNFGPFQNKEKFIPVIIDSIFKKKKIPIYGNGKQIRNWIYVKDNADAIINVAFNGKKNETYNIGTNKDFTNISLVKKICKIMVNNFGFNKKIYNLITYVKDRPGHDYKYKMDCKKIKKDLNWTPKLNFENAIKETIKWYLIKK
tara:strand:+ start:37377 stop:38360 length:984 start_codon:yes stop_codon:yes gene_type:complete